MHGEGVTDTFSAKYPEAVEDVRPAVGRSAFPERFVRPSWGNRRMQHHERITERRIGHVIRTVLKPGIFGPTVPLEARYIHCPEPVPFDKIANVAERRWRPIEVGREWGGVWESAWFRFAGRIPRDWAGREVIARIHTGGEACIFDPVDGSPVAGLDVNRDDFPLKGQARPGQRVEIWVEAAGNTLFGQHGFARDERETHRYCLERAQLACFDRAMWQLLKDVEFAFDLMLALPEDHPRRAKLLYGLNEVCNAIGDAEPAAVRRCSQILRPLLASRANASSQQVSAIGHAHIDVAWLWPLRETIRKCSRTFSTALRYMREYPEYRFVQSQAQLYEYTRQHYPKLYRQIKQAVRRGQWIPDGAMWVEADCNVTSGESLVRQLYYGKRFFQDELGVDCRVLWLPDVFGYAAAMPQILKLAGVDYFLTQKMSWSELNKFPFHSFQWEGIDGTRVLTHFPPADNYNSTMHPKEMIRAGQAYRERDRSDRWTAVFGYGDGGGGPTRGMLERIRRLGNCEELPRVVQESPLQFFRKLEAGTSDWPVWVGELYLELHRGTYTTQARIKRDNRRAELGLREAEFLCSLLPDRLSRYPHQQLDEAWKLVLLNQFHDVLPGSSIGWVYQDSRKQFQRVQEVIAQTSQVAARALTVQVDTRGTGRPVLLTNSLSWARDAVTEIPLASDERSVNVTDSQGAALPTQVTGAKGDRRVLVRSELPSMGYATVFVGPGGRRGRQSTVTATQRKLENELLRVEFDAAGLIRRIHDKPARRDAITESGSANRLELYEDRPANWDAWDVWVYYQEVQPEQAKLESVRVVERGPVRAAVEQRWSVGRSKIVQQIRLASGSRRIDFVTHVDWREDDRMLRAAFDIHVLTEKATCEIQYGHVERPTHRNTTWDVARFEVPAQKWVDLAETDYGVALLNDCKYGHGFAGSTMSLNLLRSPGDPDPRADRGEHEFTYSLLPHSGHFTEAGVIRHAYELNVPAGVWPVAKRSGELPARGALLQLDVDHVVIEAVKACRDEKAVIVRMYEAHRRRGTAALQSCWRVRQAQLVDLMERPIAKLPVSGRGVELDFRPFEIKTVKLWLTGLA